MIKKVSEEVKTSLKKEYGDKLKSLILPIDDNGTEELEVLAVVPSRNVVKYLNQDPKKAQEILVKACLVTNKEEVLADDGLFYASASLIGELIPIRQGKFGTV